MRNPFRRQPLPVNDPALQPVLYDDAWVNELAHQAHLNAAALVTIHQHADDGETAARQSWEILRDLSVEELRVLVSALAVNLRIAIEHAHPDDAREYLQKWALDVEASRYQ